MDAGKNVPLEPRFSKKAAESQWARRALSQDPHGRELVFWLGGGASAGDDMDKLAADGIGGLSVRDRTHPYRTEAADERMAGSMLG